MALSRFFPVQGIHLGAGGTYAAFNQSTLPLAGQLGFISEDGGKVYRLVLRNNTADVATVAGHVAVWKDRDNFVVSSKASESQAGVNAVAGAFLGVITNANYCFVQIGGKQNCLVAASVAAGDKLTGPTTDGTFVRNAAATAAPDEPWAIAYTAISGGKADVQWLTGKLI